MCPPAHPQDPTPSTAPSEPRLRTVTANSEKGERESIIDIFSLVEDAQVTFLKRPVQSLAKELNKSVVL